MTMPAREGHGQTHGTAHARATRRPPGFGSSPAFPNAGNSRRVVALVCGGVNGEWCMVNTVNEPSQAAIGRALGLSPAAITKLKGQGMPVHSVAAAQAWREARQNVAARKPLPPARAPLPVAPSAPGPVFLPGAFPAPDLPDDLLEGHDAARTRLRIAEANMAEMNEAKMRREMINVAVVERQLATDYATTRDALLQIPARIAPLLASESDTAAIQTLLDAEIHQALGNLIGTAEQAKNAEGAFD